jgi:hypothetical protein
MAWVVYVQNEANVCFFGVKVSARECVRACVREREIRVSA